MKLKNRDLSYLLNYWQYLKQYKLSLMIGFAMIPLISLFHLIQPILLKKGIDDHILKEDIHGLFIVASILGAAVILEYFCRTIQSYLFQRIGVRSVTAIRRDLLSHLLNLSSSYFDKTPTGTLVTRATTDIEALSESFASGLVTLLSDLLVIIGVLIAMLILSPKLTVIMIISLFIMGPVINIFRKKLRTQYNRIRTIIGSINGYLQEQLQGITVVQMMCREAKNYRTFSQKNLEYQKACTNAVFYDSSLYSIVESVSSIVIGVMIWYGFGLNQKGFVSLGLLIAFLDYTHRFFNPFKDLSAKFATLQAALAALEKIFGTFRIQEIVPSGQKTIRDFRGHLRFTDVSFAYPGYLDKPVLKNISFEIKPGEVIAIVGPTGSGKTTISRLISHLYTGYQGSIELDGIEIRELDLHELRSRIAPVLQNVSVFSTSVHFNIALGDPNISPEDVRQAAQFVQADRFIEKMDRKFETVLSGRGQKLSAGQAQLLTFARALARKTDMILLDEATSSVDSMNEKLIEQATQKIFRDKTVLVIAHRLSTVQKADRILAMKDGKIVESGSHKELMAKDGFYAKLFNMQFVHL